MTPDQLRRLRLRRMNLLMAYASFASARSAAPAAFTPASLFAAGEQGVWYDPSDLTTLYQDAAGTTPVTGLEQPVGLMLDKSKGLVLGSELVPGTYSGTVTSTWAIGSTSVTRNGASSGVAILPISGPLDLAKTYVVSFTVSNFSGDSLAFRLNNSGTARGPISANGTYTYRIPPGGTVADIRFIPWSGAVGEATITNISVRELPGNHASQSTAASRPVLRATSRIDFDATDDRMTAAASGGGTTGFLFVAGISLDGVGATQTVWSDTGTNTGYRVRINSSNQLELSAGNGTTYTTATTTETLSVTTNYVIAAWHNGTNLNVKLGTGGAIASQAFATASAGTSSFTVGMDNGAVSSQLNGKLCNVVYVRNFAGSLTDVNNTITYVNGTLV